MIAALALSLALAAQETPGVIRHGPWEGHCFRAGFLSGMDHELCKASMWAEPSGPGVEIERSREGIRVQPLPAECGVRTKSSLLPAAALTGRDRAAVAVKFIRARIRAALMACKKTLPLPALLESDMAAVLRDSDGLKAGSFLLRTASARAPAAAQCGRALAQGWRNAVKLHPAPEDGSVGLLMYTMSKQGPARAEKRFGSMRAFMEDDFAFGTGPGGAAIFAHKTAADWREPPDRWFTAICDVAIDAWSGFAELSLYPSKTQDRPIFTVRAATGVARMDGFAIGAGFR